MVAQGLVERVWEIAGGADLRDFLHGAHQRFGMANGQRTEQNRTEGGEDDRVRAYGGGNKDCDDQREAGRFPKRTGCVAQVVHDP